ncbi:creatininase family protein [Methylobacterium nodulans]|uniref:Creatininase n=1 Tax=Methylobacterium nodulans (strain LMG 21967 / CNCM I-2342 / ORS 2060) TaxID=460265 RepID=B8IVK5_METNO|nr:creatininase family protein [Methylobacterium nodulans]ACL62445.1 Creatininase [Methylobacterium nodulans ORS 2060]
MTVSTEMAPPEVAWNRLSAEALNDLARRDAIVLLPVASTEQHGPHLPTGVDDFLGTAVCRRTAELVAPDRPIVVAPTVWCGLADHHVAFGGTFTLSLATYHALLRDLCRSILAAGFRKVVLVNSHGGNITALSSLAVELTRELDAPIATATYFMEAADAVSGILEDQGNVMHACEAETSMMMALDSDLVDATRLAEAHGPGFDIADSLMPTLKRVRGWQEVSRGGVAGDARRASAAKGEAVLDACALALAARLRAGDPWA